MDFFNQDLNPTKNKTAAVDENQAIKIRDVEHKFKFTFDPWLHAFAMKVSYPVKVYSWFLASNKYKVTWDSATRIMDFVTLVDKENEARYHWASYGLQRVKSYLGKELYDHFGSVKFAINGEIQK